MSFYCSGYCVANETIDDGTELQGLFVLLNNVKLIAKLILVSVAVSVPIDK